LTWPSPGPDGVASRSRSRAAIGIVRTGRVKFAVGLEWVSRAFVARRLRGGVVFRRRTQGRCQCWRISGSWTAWPAAAGQSPALDRHHNRQVAGLTGIPGGPLHGLPVPASGCSTAVSLRAVWLMLRSRSLTDRGLKLAASASSSWVRWASSRSCRSSPAKLSADCSATVHTPPDNLSSTAPAPDGTDPAPTVRSRPRHRYLPGPGQLGGLPLLPLLPFPERSRPEPATTSAVIAAGIRARAGCHRGASGWADSCGRPVSRHVW
jgi:hypothetical protein